MGVASTTSSYIDRSSNFFVPYQTHYSEMSYPNPYSFLPPVSHFSHPAESSYVYTPYSWPPFQNQGFPVTVQGSSCGTTASNYTTSSTAPSQLENKILPATWNPVSSSQNPISPIRHSETSSESESPKLQIAESTSNVHTYPKLTAVLTSAQSGTRRYPCLY